MKNRVIIGIAELAVETSPIIIVTLGLGSCVGVTMYDPYKKIGGMIHIMISNSRGDSRGKPAKFADTGVPLLLSRIIERGADKNNLIVKIAGGAKMFGNHVPTLNVGEKNVDAVKKSLKDLGLKIKAEDTGGSRGRTIELYLETGELVVKSIGKEVKRI